VKTRKNEKKHKNSSAFYVSAKSHKSPEDRAMEKFINSIKKVKK